MKMDVRPDISGESEKQKLRERQWDKTGVVLSPVLSLSRPFCRTVVGEIATVGNVRYRPP